MNILMDEKQTTKLLEYLKEEYTYSISNVDDRDWSDMKFEVGRYYEKEETPYMSFLKLGLHRTEPPKYEKKGVPSTVVLCYPEENGQNKFFLRYVE